ncbi:MAG: hypothetical protein AAGD25_06900 [Cyanobacteria bacterium P01_F01_bin.150]
MINPYSTVKQGLSVFPNNMHLGQENITIVFKVEGAVTGTDRLGNNEREETVVTIKGKATIASVTRQNQELPGTGNRYLPLKVNVTTVNGSATTALPVTIAPKMAVTATYRQSNGRDMVGQFQVQPSLSKSVNEIHAKVGDIIYGMLEVSGDGTS